MSGFLPTVYHPVGITSAITAQLQSAKREEH